MQISQSDVVRVRGGRWRVAGIRAYDCCELLTLVGVGPTNRGRERHLLAPFDRVERIERRSRLTRVPHRLWRRACRALIAADTPPASLTRARQARIDLFPHQLEPALALLRGLGTRVLLADDVGLGKTIQAGLIVAELRANNAAERVLIITPAGLRDQWAGELFDRFRIDATVLDARAVRRLICSVPVGINPWQTVPVAIASVDYIKQTEVLAVVGACHWDVVVVDEAHGIAGDSDRHAAVSTLAASASYVVLLTATPHSGDRRAFASLCSIGRADPLATRSGETGETLLVFRRSRQDISLETRRKIHRLAVRLNHDERRMHALLARFSRAIWLEHQTGRSRNDYWLALAVLHKRALSSARSLQLSIDRRLTVLMKSTSTEETSLSQISLPFGDRNGEQTVADEAPAWSPLLSLRNGADERRLLAALARASENAARHETKIAALARLLRRVDEPAIVFTEYRDTLLHLQASLGLSAVTLHGGMHRNQRLEAIRHFTHGGGRLLLATDAGGEGLNLQSTCRLVINLELPWNPTRLEQRIGRVDRIGQRRPVHVIHLIARDTNESRVLVRLQTRVARARADIGGADPLGVSTATGTAEPTQEFDDGNRFARVVITNETGDVPPADPTDTGPLADYLWTPPIAADAQFEAGRLSAARALVRDGDESVLVRFEGVGPAGAIARSWRTRAWLHGRALMVWRVTAEDGIGRVVGSTVVAVAVPQGFRHDDAEVLKCVDRAAEEWRTRVSAAHGTFIDMRLGREQRTDVVPEVAQGFQPNLFDRRDERALLAIAASRSTAAQDRAHRIASIEASRTLSFSRPQLVLVLEPRSGW